MTDKYMFCAFVLGKGRSGGEWVTEPSGMRLYVRRSIRVKGGFELANIEVPEQLQKQGILTRFLIEYAHLALRIENVQNSHLERWLLKQEKWIVEDPSWIGTSSTFHNQVFEKALWLRAAQDGKEAGL